MGCANNEETAEEAYINDVVRAYETAQTAVTSGNYRRAIGLFENIQSRFPFSDLSTQIQLELMYAYYKSGAKEQTIDQTEAFRIQQAQILITPSIFKLWLTSKKSQIF